MIEPSSDHLKFRQDKHIEKKQKMEAGPLASDEDGMNLGRTAVKHTIAQGGKQPVTKKQIMQTFATMSWEDMLEAFEVLDRQRAKLNYKGISKDLFEQSLAVRVPTVKRPQDRADLLRETQYFSNTFSIGSSRLPTLTLI